MLFSYFSIDILKKLDKRVKNEVILNLSMTFLLAGILVLVFSGNY